jgi:hypothetical protein
MRKYDCKYARGRKTKKTQTQPVQGVFQTYKEPVYHYVCKLSGRICLVDLAERLTSKRKDRDYFLERCPSREVE